MRCLPSPTKMISMIVPSRLPIAIDKIAQPLRLTAAHVSEYDVSCVTGAQLARGVALVKDTGRPKLPLSALERRGYLANEPFYHFNIRKHRLRNVVGGDDERGHHKYLRGRAVCLHRTSQQTNSLSS